MGVRSVEARELGPHLKSVRRVTGGIRGKAASLLSLSLGFKWRIAHSELNTHMLNSCRYNATAWTYEKGTI